MRLGRTWASGVEVLPCMATMIAVGVSDVAGAIQLGATVCDLAECELCYAPPFGSAKDPVNFAGMVAASRTSIRVTGMTFLRG